ncbi:MAG: HAMP domain-containing histidine kinase [Acetatifactor sp.]|nr:HAMP domain-containing histidine kinase [Acetatifactor sp.]
MALSFLIFFVGVSLTLYHMSGLLRCIPDGISSWTSGKLLEDDYQQSWEFQNYMTNRLESFLSIAINGYPAGWDYYGWNETSVVSEAVAQGGSDWSFVGNPELWREYGGTVEEYEEYEEAMEELYNSGYWDEYGGWYGYNDQFQAAPREQLTEEQLAQKREKLTRMYFANIEEDKNLIYSIYYDRKLLYSNSDLLVADGSMQTSEGYNFLMYFDGEKVRISKDGKEIDIYGDGYYQNENNDWYVPGYRNFPVNDEMKKTVICMAAAKEPVLYTTGIDKSGGYQQQNNSLYWMQYNNMRDRKMLRRNFIGLVIGVALLFFSCFCRKKRREALEKIAFIQGKIWVECKGLLLFLLFLLLYAEMRKYYPYGGYGSLWWELVHGYDVSVTEVVGTYGGALLSPLWYMPLFWVESFWAVYLIVNDLKHNKKVWRQGLIAKCCDAYSARELKLPFARRMIRRNAILFTVIVVCGILMMAGTLGIVKEYRLWTYNNVWKIFVLYLFVTLCLLVAAYLTGIKNIKAARDVDALSDRIHEICNGNYSDNAGTQYTGHDLGATMTQLENIRQGMASAVDEQMRSERMKVELIANVSHDIKTPLTSIISYVQFLKEEEGLPEHVKDYVKILDEKSQRLKNMVQDVFAVSKAASGELPMNMEKLDFGKLLRQTMADMDEEIQSSRVSFRTELPEEPVMIMADGQRMYRVFQNLFQNALKYSLDGSRVYVTLKTDGKLAVASVKNTSHMELDEDKNFTERFVRGDKSRTDGGSGLGLSIAQSFTEACGGQFGLEFNADLFIVSISFEIVEDA